MQTKSKHTTVWLTLTVYQNNIRAKMIYINLNNKILGQDCFFGIIEWITNYIKTKNKLIMNCIY